MNQILSLGFWLHDWASAFLAKHLFGIKRGMLIVAHLALFGFLFPDLRKSFGEMAAYTLLLILFLSPVSKIFRTRLLLQLMGLRRELGILMAYLATVHGLGYILDPEWFDLLIAPYLKVSLFAINPALLFGATAYLLTLPLLLTSNSWAQRSLGKNWKRLHKIVYVLFVVVLMHRFLIKGGGTVEFIQLGVLLGSYVLAKLLAWKNFFAPLQKTIDWVALRYREYTLARQSATVAGLSGNSFRGKMEELNREIRVPMENEMMPPKEDATPVQQEKTVVSEKRLMKEALLISGSLLLGSLIIAGAILTLAPQVGTLVGSDTNKGANPEVAAPADPTNTNAVTSIDNDPVLGDKKKAKVAIVEYSDLECPFCKRFHAETFDQLVKEYVDTGKAIIVARDFPLSFHDPKATEEAAFAECVRKEKGDSAYFAFTKGIYENTVANGKGLAAGKMDELIGKMGANVKTVTACSTTEAVKQEIQKDIADGSKAGVSGTPSFIIGTLDANGNVTGERVVGALPIDGFKAKIEKYLAQ